MSYLNINFIRGLVLSAGLALNLGCLSPGRYGESAVQRSIRSVLDQQLQGWNEGNIEKFMEGYQRSDSVRFASGGTVTYGWKEMLARYQKGYPDKAAMGQLEFRDIEIRPITRSNALVFGSWVLKREQDELSGLFTLLFRRTKNGWRIVYDHTSQAE